MKCTFILRDSHSFSVSSISSSYSVQYGALKKVFQRSMFSVLFVQSKHIRMQSAAVSGALGHLEDKLTILTHPKKRAKHDKTRAQVPQYCKTALVSIFRELRILRRLLKHFTPQLLERQITFEMLQRHSRVAFCLIPVCTVHFAPVDRRAVPLCPKFDSGLSSGRKQRRERERKESNNR